MKEEWADGTLSFTLTAVADSVNNIAVALERRPADKARCNCHIGGPGLCAHHAWAHEQLREAEAKLKSVSDYLLRTDW